MVAAPGGRDYGRLSVMLQFRYRVSRLFIVPAGAFSPAPKVSSAIVRLMPRPIGELPAVDEATFARVVTAAFGQRRKTLRNALDGVLDEAAIRASAIDPGARAERLAVGEFVDLALQVTAVAGSGPR
jgi:16S rRNA (adenine1518-N6/adenine1519-N6)-dimethyltransferase